MSWEFDPSQRAVYVPVVVTGPAQEHRFRLLPDTGANITSLRGEYLRRLGFDLGVAPRRRMNSATGVTSAAVVRVPAVTTLGQQRTGFEVAALDPPGAVAADGLLGLDFFRGLVLTVDFARGRVSLRPPRPWWRVW